MLNVKISKELEVCLDEVAAKTKHSKDYLVSKALKQYLEDEEDYHDAIEALKITKPPYVSLDKMRRILGLGN